MDEMVFESVVYHILSRKKASASIFLNSFQHILLSNNKERERDARSVANDGKSFSLF
jgi:hypothetical protein